MSSTISLLVAAALTTFAWAGAAEAGNPHHHDHHNRQWQHNQQRWDHDRRGEHWTRNGNHRRHYHHRHHAEPVYFRDRYGACFRVETHRRPAIYVEVPREKCWRVR